ncbi:MAG: MgtC/SapB family protein [Candidatus Omnitrophica bacterium]|nr:MgtC/SapB family protein [Candidatus Omnitrophota bacterium]
MLSNWVILFRLLLAAALSGVVGFEREFHGRAAGFRTHILLCMGSTLIMLTSIHIFEVYSASAPCDPARIAAGVITGIGFLGAGAIMRSRGSVRGLTTASSLWVMTGVGLAVGSGMYFGATITTFLTIVALMVFGRLEHTMIRKDWYKTLAIEMKEGTDYLKAVKALVAEYEGEITDFDIERAKEGDLVTLRIGVKLRDKRQVEALLQDAGRIEGVRSASWAID